MRFSRKNMRMKGQQMARNVVTHEARLQILVPRELKERLRQTAAGKGVKLSTLVRESIEEKIEDWEREVFEGKMRNAYIEMADENISVVEDFRYSDAENL
jgi:predicted DNA-binding protein